jgi:hypothetical protein
MTRFADILQRGTLTDDPTGLFLRLNWFEYDGTSAPVRSEPVCYIAFSDADEQALITLVQSWIADTAY